MREMLERVAIHVDGDVLADCGHFLPEERPEELVRRVLAMTANAPGPSSSQTPHGGVTP